MHIPNIQKSQSFELPPPPHRTTEDVQPTELNEAPPVRRLDGEVTRTGDIAFTAGPHCEIWIGEWVKGGRTEGGEGDVEKVRLRPIYVCPANLVLYRWP